MTGEKYREIIKKKLDYIMRENNCWLLFSLLYKCKLYKMTEDGEEETKEVSFFSEKRRILQIVDYNET